MAAGSDARRQSGRRVVHTRHIDNKARKKSKRVRIRVYAFYFGIEIEDKKSSELSKGRGQFVWASVAEGLFTERPVPRENKEGPGGGSQKRSVYATIAAPVKCPGSRAVFYVAWRRAPTRAGGSLATKFTHPKLTPARRRSLDALGYARMSPVPTKRMQESSVSSPKVAGNLIEHAPPMFNSRSDCSSPKERGRVRRGL